MMIADFTIGAELRERIQTSVEANVPPYKFDEYTEFSAGCSRAAALLRPSLDRWISDTRHISVGLLRGLPQDQNLGDTPTIQGAADHIAMTSDAVLGTIAAIFGAIYTFADKAVKRHIHNVHPAHGFETSQLAASTVELEWHVEDGFSENRPDWILLLCLRGNASVETRVARARDLQLPPETVNFLRMNDTDLIVDDSFVAGGDQECTRKVRVLSGPTEDPEIIFDPAYTRYSSDKERSHHQRVALEAKARSYGIILSAGECLIIDNKRTIHARSGYAPAWDGSDRWLKRTHVTQAPRLRARLQNGLIGALDRPGIAGGS